MSLRVALVCSSAAAVTGGIESTVDALARELSRRYDVTMVVGGRRAAEELDSDTGLRVLTLPFVSRFGTFSKSMSTGYRRFNPFLLESLSLYLSFLASPRARRILAASDVVSIHTKYDSLLFSRWTAFRGIPSVYHIQGDMFGRRFIALNRSTRYVGVSETSRRDLAGRFHLPVLDSVPPGVPDALLTAAREEDDSILFVARLYRTKGTLEAIRIFANVSNAYPSLRLNVIGEGPDRAEMEREARRLGVEDRAIFLGSLPQAQVFPYYSKAKALLFPSKAEVYGLVPLEAMATGCPVIASDIPGVRESTGGHAILIPTDAFDTWVATTIRVLGDANERASLGIHGRSWASVRTWSRVSLEYERQLLLAGDARLANAIRC